MARIRPHCPELMNLLTMPSAEIRRLAASAIGKLAGFGADAVVAVRALAPAALHDPHPQVQQYALKATQVLRRCRRQGVSWLNLVP